MTLRVATFNVENLFTRPAAMADGSGDRGQAAIDAHAELNAIVRKPVYTDADRARLLALDRTYRFSALTGPARPLLVLVKVRGQLYARRDGETVIAADGAADWTGWFELTRRDIRWQATYNTARVIAESKVDVLLCVEAEDRHTLLRFNDEVLGSEFGQAFPHVMLVDGNDARGIDVGVLSRYPIDTVRSHVDDRDAAGARVFSRDCPEYAIVLPGGRRLVVLPNHFKSKRGGNDDATRLRRRLQAQTAATIARRAVQAGSPLVLLGGDLNDTPDSDTLAPLRAHGFRDVQSHPSYPTDRPGTYGTGRAAEKIDYLVMSPQLRRRLVGTGIERRGSYHPRTWKPFDTVTRAADQASDHHLLWADFAL
jgi:endonuclease/exonuclease/phosphatase family metal-dependent hydrolase